MPCKRPSAPITNNVCRRRGRLCVLLTALCAVLLVAGTLTTSEWPLSRPSASAAYTHALTASGAPGSRRHSPQRLTPSSFSSTSTTPLHPSAKPRRTGRPRGVYDMRESSPALTVPLSSAVWRSTQCYMSVMLLASLRRQLAQSSSSSNNISNSNSSRSGGLSPKQHRGGGAGASSRTTAAAPSGMDRFLQFRLFEALKTRDALGMHAAESLCVYGWDGAFLPSAPEDTRTVATATRARALLSNNDVISGEVSQAGRTHAVAPSQLALFSGPQNHSQLCVDDDTISGTEGFTGAPSSTYVDFMVRPCAASAESVRRVGGTREAITRTWHAATLGRNGLGLVIAGDSVFRQLFMRYVAVERGQVEGTEHYTHHDMLYILYGRTDRVVPMPVRAALQRTGNAYFIRRVLEAFYPAYYDLHVRPRVGDSAAGGGEAYDGEGFEPRHVKMTVLFIWMTNPHECSQKVMPLLAHPRPPSLITYFGYHTANENASQAMAALTSAVAADNRRRGPRGNLNSHFLILATVRATGSPELHERNRNTRLLFSDNTESHAGLTYLLDFDAVAAAAGPLVAADAQLMHTACTFTPQMPQTPATATGTRDSCRDAMGFNALVWLAHLMRLALRDMA